MELQKVDFVLEYEVKPREFSSMCLLAAYLRNKGYTVAFLNSWKSIYEKPRAYQAEVAVISACYNDGTYDYFTGHIASYKKVVNMQWEQVLISGYYQPREDDSYVYQGVGKYTRHVCWGEKERAWLQESFGIEDKYLKVVGYLPLDFYRKELSALLPSREQLFSQYGLELNKKTLLFVSSFSAIDFPDTEDCGNQDIFLISEKISRKSQAILLEWFERLVQIHPEIQIVYRYHPSEKNSPSIRNVTETNKGIYAIQDEPISYWIMACDKIYNWSSTSITEMLSSGKDVYLCRPIPVPEQIDYSFFHNVQCIDSYEKFEASALEPKMKDSPVDRPLLEQWYDIQEKPVYQRLGDWLIETYHDSSYVSRPSHSNIFRFNVCGKIKKIIRRAIFYTKLAEYSSRLLGENALTKRLQKIHANVLAENMYQKSVQEEDGYVKSRYHLNKFTEDEVEEMIEQYRNLIMLNMGSV